MTLITKYNETKRWHPARVLQVLAWAMLGMIPGSRAAGTPGEKPAGHMVPYKIVFTLINNGAVAGSGVEDQVRVTIIDVGNGNAPVPNFPIQIKFDNSISSDNEVTDASGNYIVKLSGDEVGTTDVHIIIPGVKDTYVFNYTAGPPSPGGGGGPGGGGPGGGGGGTSGTRLVVDVPVAPDDGNTPAVIHAHIENQYGADYPGLPVTFYKIGGTAAGTAVWTVIGTGVTDANGDVAINIKNLKPGTVILYGDLQLWGNRLSYNDKQSGDGDLVARPDPTNPATQLIVDVPKAPADGNATTTIHAHVMGDDGLPLAGSMVVFTKTGTGTADGTAIVTIIGTGYTDANGDAYITIKNFKPGTVIFTATAQDLITTTTYPIVNNSPATVRFTSITPDVNNPATALIVDVPQAPAGGGIAVIHAHIVGDDGLPMENAQVVFTKTGTGTADGTAVVVIIGTGYTDANGDTYINITNPSIGTVDLTATVQFGTGPVLSVINGSPATVKFVQPPPDPTNPATALFTDVPTVLANASDKAVVRAHIVGTDGKVQAGVPVTFTISDGTAQGTAVVTIVNGITDINGDAVITISNANVGTVSFTATAKDLVTGTDYPIINGSPATVNFIVGPPVPGDPGGGGTGGTPPGNGGNPPGGGSGPGGNNNGPGDNKTFTLLFVRQDFRLGDGTQQDSVIAFVTDAYHHPLKGVTIQFLIQSAPDAGTATPYAKFASDPNAVLTDDSGMARIAVTSTKPGTVFINAVLVIQGVLIDGSYQIVTFANKPDVNNPLTNLSVVIYEALADGVSQAMVKAHIVDLDGNIMAGQEVVFKIDSGDAQIVTPAPVLTDANGDAYISIVSKKPGIAAITATVGGEKIIFGSPARVKFAVINIYVPKVFTPNNDGTNDLLKPILVGISTFHYWSIYNRWGNLIYTSRDPNRGWDGTWKGVAQPVETYVWIAEGVDVNGKTIVQKGMTSLVR